MASRDLESSFSVLFWICVHHDALGKNIRPAEFDDWYYENDDMLATLKLARLLIRVFSDRQRDIPHLTTGH